MSYLARPLSRGAVTAADDAFYAKHPELAPCGNRIPLDRDDPAQAQLREEWRELYKQNGGKTTETPPPRREQARVADKQAKKNFGHGRVGKPIAGCPLQESSPPAPEPTPPPVQPKPLPCKEGGQVCTVKSVGLQCSHGARGGKLGPGNRLQVVPGSESQMFADTADGKKTFDPTVSPDKLILTSAAATCGKVTKWTISGGANDSVSAMNHNYPVRGWLWRGAVGFDPMSRWAMQAAPRQYRVRAELDCGSLGEVYNIDLYPSDKVKHKIKPDEVSAYQTIKEELINKWLKAILGERFECEFLRGFISFKGYWAEDKNSWEAFYAYDIIVGFDPLIKLAYKVPLLLTVGPAAAIPAKVKDWITKYLGDGLYLSLGGELGVDGRMTRTGPKEWAAWSVNLGGAVFIELGLELKVGSGKVLSGAAKGKGSLSGGAKLGPKEKDSDPYFKLDAKFDGLKGFVEVKVASGWYTFEQEYVLVGEEVLLSNYQVTIFD